MSQNAMHGVADLSAYNDAVLRAIQGATREAALDHKRTGHPIAAWRDGKVVMIPPEEIEVPEIKSENGKGQP